MEEKKMRLAHDEGWAPSSSHEDPNALFLNLRDSSPLLRDGSNGTSCDDSRADYALLMESHNRRAEVLHQYRRLVELKQEHKTTKRKSEEKEEKKKEEKEGEACAVIQNKLESPAERTAGAVGKTPSKPRSQVSPSVSNSSPNRKGPRQLSTSSYTWIRPRSSLSSVTESFAAKRRQPVSPTPSTLRGPVTPQRNNSLASQSRRESKQFGSRHTVRRASDLSNRTPLNAALPVSTPPVSTPPVSTLQPTMLSDSALSISRRREPVAPKTLSPTEAHESPQSPQLVRKAIAAGEHRAPEQWGIDRDAAATVVPPIRATLDETLLSTAPSDIPAAREAFDILTEEDKEQMAQQRSASNRRLSGSANRVSNGVQVNNMFEGTGNTGHSTSQRGNLDEEESRTRRGRESGWKSKTRRGQKEAEEPTSPRKEGSAGKFNSYQDWKTADESNLQRDTGTPPPSKLRSTQNAFDWATEPVSPETTPRHSRCKGEKSATDAEFSEEFLRPTVASHQIFPSFATSRSADHNEVIPTPTISSNHTRSSVKNLMPYCDTPRTAKDKAARIASVAGVLQAVLVQTRRVMPCYFCGELQALSAYHLHLDFCRSRTETLYARYNLNPTRLVSCEPLMPLPGNMSSHAEKKCFANACYQGVKESIIPCPECNAVYRVHDLPDHQSVCVPRRELIT